jgi:hypothetical protein
MIASVAILLMLCSTPVAAKDYDLVVYGGTPAGLTAAIAAGRQNAAVVVLEPSRWLGGMVTGGLASTDLGRQETIGGIAREFFTRASAQYNGKFMWYAEPHVNAQTFATMLAEAQVETHTASPLKSVDVHDGKILGITTADGQSWHGAVFIDATYEGDLMARSGVKYIVGRESRETYGEPLAGYRLDKPRGFSPEVMHQGCACVGGQGPHYVHGAPTAIDARDANGKLLWGVTTSDATAGSKDRLTQSYNFRLTVTQQPDNRVPWPKPAHYEPDHYELLLRLIEKYPQIPFARLVHLAKLAGNKFDLNAQGLFSTDYVGGNVDYPDGDEATRRRIWQDHVDYVQGFLWFLGHDERVPQRLRDDTNSWGLARDEFVDNAHWPYALYVREARRMLGRYVMRQSDIQTEVSKPDGIAMGSFIIDSHIVQRIADPQGIVLDEGAFDAPSWPYQIPYRSVTPERDQCRNLLVPVCLAASHVAYGSIRMEPVYMQVGHACGLAALDAARSKVAVQDIDVSALQSQLRREKQVLEYTAPQGPRSRDLPGLVVDDMQAEFKGAWQGSNFAAGVDGGYRHDGNTNKGQSSATFRVSVPRAGVYEVRFGFTTSTNRATSVPVTVTSVDGSITRHVSQRSATSESRFISLGKFRFDPAKPAVIVVDNTGTDGYVVVDAVQLIAEP